MLVSHSKKFIFLKTMKTAGTSVEIYLERYCVPSDTYVEQHHRAETAPRTGSSAIAARTLPRPLTTIICRPRS